MNDRDPRLTLTSERTLVHSAAEIASSTARWSTRVALVPALALPSGLRRAVFDSARLAAESVALLPRAALYTLQGITGEVDDLDARSSRREDLGRRLQREARQAGFQPRP